MPEGGQAWQPSERRPLKPQRAELRLYVVTERGPILGWQATLKGYDLYSGLPPVDGEEFFRHSLHESGQSHFHVYGERIITNRDSLPSPKDIKGVASMGSSVIPPRRLGASTSTPTESPHRRNLILDPKTVGAPAGAWNVRLWLIEHGRLDLADAVVEDNRHFSWLVLGTLHAKWTDPQLLAVIVCPTPEQWAMAQSRNVPAIPWRPKMSIEVKPKGSI
jgi:hypothetical protein